MAATIAGLEARIAAQDVVIARLIEAVRTVAGAVDGQWDEDYGNHVLDDVDRILRTGLYR